VRFSAAFFELNGTRRRRHAISEKGLEPLFAGGTERWVSLFLRASLPIVD